MALNDKQARFVAEYLKDMNATAAYKRAGYTAKGNAAEVNAARLLRNAQVQSEVAKRTQKLMGKLEISAERVLRERARLAFLDPRKLVDANGKPLGVHELDEDTAAAVAGFETERGRITKLKLASKDASLTALEKHLGLYKDDAGNGSPLHIHLHLGD